jgi:TrpR-related protein YerC/YecD
MAVNPKLKDEEADHLFKGILQLKNIDECYMFFEDVCTITEIKAMAQRFAVAHMLRNGKTYNEIADATGASSATISRVNRFIKYGADGYNIVLDRLEQESGSSREYKPE